MPGRTARGSFRGARSQRAPTSWAGLSVSDATVAAGVKQIVGSFVPVPGLSHETLVRAVGEWEAIGGNQGPVVLGMCVITDAAFTAGAASIPDPLTEISDDIWAFISSISIATSVTDVPRTRSFDSRAMRKVEEGSRLILMISNGNGVSIGFSVYMRILTKVGIRG